MNNKNLGGQVTKVEGRFSDNSEPYKYVNDIGYDEYGQRVFIEYGNGVKTEYEYNPERRWLNKIKTSKDSNVYQNIKYEFDNVGNVNGYINDCLTASNGNYITKQKYEYDELYQLTKVTGYTESNKYKLQTPDLLSEYTQEFKFDSIGNMTQKKSTEWVKYNRKVGDDLNYNTLEYTIMPGYAHRVQNIGGRYFEYDAAGNIIVEQDGKIDLEDSSKYYKIEQIDENKYIADSAWGYYTDEDRENNKTKVYRRTYEWDDKNQLIKSQDDNVTVCYTYGSDGQRASKYTENSETLYTNDFWVFHVSGSVRNGAGIINKNIYLGKMRVVTKVKEAFDAMEITERQCQYFYHSDHLGSAQLVTDNNGNEYQRIEYTPYGETWIDLKATQNDLVKLNYKFTAKELDEETGLYYYGARYLDPKYSMWISTDPAMNTGEYFPVAPTSEDARSHNQNLPGLGGVFNTVNLNLYHYAGNNPIKFSDPTGLHIDDWQNNRDGTWTVKSEGAKIWDVWGADAYKVTGLSEAEAKNIQVGQTFGKKNNPKTPVGLAVLDKTTSIADSGVGVALGEIELAYANALKPFVSQKFNNLNIPEGVIIGFRSPNSVYAQELRQFANSLKNISNTLFIIGIGIGLADSIYCGVSNHSWEAGLKRAGRYVTTTFVGFAVTYIGSALGGPWAGAILGFGAAMYVDSWFEKKGW